MCYHRSFSHDETQHTIGRGHCLTALSGASPRAQPATPHLKCEVAEQMALSGLASHSSLATSHCISNSHTPEFRNLHNSLTTNNITKPNSHSEGLSRFTLHFACRLTNDQSAATPWEEAKALASSPIEASSNIAPSRIQLNSL